MLTDFILTEGNFEAIKVLLTVQTGLNLLDKTLNTLLLFHLWSYFWPFSGLLLLVTPMSSSFARCLAGSELLIFALLVYFLAECVNILGRLDVPPGIVPILRVLVHHIRPLP